MFGLFQQSMLILKKIEDINGIITVPYDEITVGGASTICEDYQATSCD